MSKTISQLPAGVLALTDMLEVEKAAGSPRSVQATLQQVQDLVTGGLVPVGGIVSWAKSFTGTPSLPDAYAECNGQTVADGASPYDGQALPNLNGSGSGTQRFLRGATVSGGEGGSDLVALCMGVVEHGSGYTLRTFTVCGNATWGAGSAFNGGSDGGTSAVVGLDGWATGGQSGTIEIRGGYWPQYYEVVMVMRIK